MRTGWIFLKLFMVFTLQVNAQFVVKGQIKDSEGLGVANANAVCRSPANKIIAYAFSNHLGYYELQVKNQGEYTLEFSSLGFQSKSESILLPKAGRDTITVDIVLEKHLIKLDEVILAKDRPIVIKKDTIVFDAEAFSRGNEEVVEDLIKNLPNVEVDTEGTIKIGGKEVEKVMIEGDDFFRKGYKMITRNMPSQPIDKVELIENYLENELLKNISDSDKIALNLKLKEEAKRVWFGNIEIAHGLTTRERYELSGILMNFGKKNKFYFFSNLNDTGVDAKGNIDNLINPVGQDDIGTVGEGERAYKLLNFSGVPLNFKKKRTNFNNSELLSLNAIFNPNKVLKITTNGFFNWDENSFFRNSISIVNAQGANFTNTENHKLLKNNSIGFGKVVLTYKPSASQSLNSEISINKNDDSSSTNLLFNSSSSKERLNTSNTLVDGTVTYTNRYSEKSVLLLAAHYIYEDVPQDYTIDQFIYPELFPQGSNIDNVVQNNNSIMNFAGVEVQLLNKQRGGQLLALKAGDQYRSDSFISNLILQEEENIVERPADYLNNLVYTVNDLYLKTEYSWKFTNLGVTAGLEAHQLLNSIEVVSGKENQTPFFINPQIGIDWTPNKKNALRFAYSHSTTNANILDVFDNYALTGFRSFNRGTGSFNQLEASKVLFNYQLGNWADKFFVNTSILYLKNHDFFSGNTLLAQNYSLTERIVIQDRDLLNFNAKIDYFVRALSSNVKLDLGFSETNFKNIINNSALREITSKTYNCGLQLRSGFTGKFNFHLGTKWIKNSVLATTASTFTDNVSFLDLSYVAGDRLNFDLESERYFFGNLNRGNNTYYFLDFTMRYILQPKKLELGLSGNNLFNTSTYRTFSLSDIGSYVAEFRLLPRYVLLKLKYRF